MAFVMLVLLGMNAHQSVLLEQETGSSATQKKPQVRVASVKKERSPFVKRDHPPVSKDLVKHDDYIYKQPTDVPRWDASPVVIESHKLIFFTIPKVGCTVWKQLFRRMMGYEDWQLQDETTHVPHNPAENGLKYLSDYSLEDANRMMTSPEWTRAIMLRNPKQRYLSAFLDKAVSNYHVHIKERCCPDESCVEDAQNITGFLNLCRWCEDEHWRAQNDRVEAKYWPYMDFVGHVEKAAPHARALLERIGAWDKYGASGWGSEGNSSMFGSQGLGGEHTTWSQYKHWQWYTPESEKQVEEFYRADYANPLFGFTKDCLTCVDEEEA